MVDLALIAYSLIAAISTAIVIVLVTNRGAWIPIIGNIVSRVSDGWADAVERGRAQKAQRDRLYGYGIESDDIGIEPVVPAVVLPALGAEYTGTSVPDREIASRADALDILARARVDGKYLFTANKLADLFTGTAYAASRNIILDEVAKIRNPEKTAPAATHGAPLKRPANGWN